MKNRIEHLEIKNFKSLKHIKFDCKRINLFIGKPNVGKSNVLEALSLFIAPYANHASKFLADYVRYETPRNLFYDQDRKNQILVNSNLGFAAMRFHLNSINQYDIIIGPEISLLKELSNAGAYTLNEYNDVFHAYTRALNNKSDAIKPFYNWMGDDAKMFQGNLRSLGYDTPIRKYQFKSLTEHKSNFSLFLSPPYGDNLYTILENNPKLYDECTNFFNEYKLDLLLDTVTEKIEVQKRVGNRVYKIPYSLAADTLQRYIFYLMAIETNKNAILLLEEPEAHCFPPYIREFSQKVIDSEDNQFFITTHSPFVLNTIIENADKKDVAVFVLEYKNYQTNIKALSDKELSNMLNYGYDIFSTLK